MTTDTIAAMLVDYDDALSASILEGLQAGKPAQHTRAFRRAVRARHAILSALEERERLRSLLKEAGEGLGPFAAVAVEAGDKQSDDACWCGQNGAVIRYSDLRKARSLFTKIREVLGSASLRAEADNGQG